MIIKTIGAINFRNYDFFKISLSPYINIFYGNNGEGKTNILESIYLLGITKSHRVNNDKYLIKKKHSNLKVQGTITNQNVSDSLEVIIDLKTKILKKNKKLIKTIDYINTLNVIIFYPDDLSLIKGSPQERRKFLNVEISQLNKKYLIALHEYNKILKIRNELLKKRQKHELIDLSYFDIITDLYIKKSLIIFKYRYEFIIQIDKIIDHIYEDITGFKNMTLKYLCSFDEYDINGVKNNELLKQNLLNILNKEIKYGTSLIGPHRDDINFILDTKDLKLYGSQGQQKLAILSLKLSEMELYKNQEEKPILLLDDVFSEIDETKKNNILKYLNQKTQIIITTTDLTNIDSKIINNSKIFEIKNEKIIEKGDLDNGK
ncbi:MAG: DNA replication/repair protein RecF [Bacilli bacterium]|nr:DNA replication/repair protein RecF [Bacilli bacterium]